MYLMRIHMCKIMCFDLLVITKFVYMQVWEVSISQASPDKEYHQASPGKEYPSGAQQRLLVFLQRHTANVE